VLDHHKTAVDYYTTSKDCRAAPDNLQLHFDLERSGAAIARDYFLDVGKLSPNQDLLFRYIEDADLWRWQMPHSKAFTSGLIARHLEYDATRNPGIFSYLETIDPAQVIKEGEVVLQGEMEEIERILSDAFIIQLGGQQHADETIPSSCWGRALGVRLSSEKSTLRSQVGNELALRSSDQGLLGIGVVIYKEPGMLDSQGTESTKVKVSLRSVQGGPDTTIISRYFGGGGHHNASSFLADENEIAQWIDLCG
jgi:oligoribonuclease NrnB/cAMP/cGMP phosphodiesterase (DHH superfamily)